MTRPVLTSARSAPVAAARRLRRRSGRHADRAFLVEGRRAVTEALAARPPALTRLLLADGARDRHADLARTAAEAGVEVLLVADRLLTDLADTVTPAGVVGVATFRDVTLPALLRGRPRLLAVLAEVRDPGNAGTVLRTADAAGADGVIFAGAAVDPYNGKCVRASAGSLFHLPLVLGARAADVVADLRAAGVTVLAAAAGAATDLAGAESAGLYAGPVAWLFGSEAHGLPPGLAAAADRSVRVPIYGRAESLNLATAAALCLYATARAQRAT